MYKKLIFQVLISSIIGLFVCTGIIFADVIPEKPQVITSESASFTTINLITTDGSTIYYTLDGSIPTIDSQVYTNGIIIPKNTTIQPITIKIITALNGATSEVFTSEISINPLPIRSGGGSSGSGGGGVIITPIPVILTPIISKMGFTSSDGMEITDVGANVKLRGYADIDNKYGIAKDNIASFFVACYIDNKLYYAKTFTASIDANTLSKRVATDILDVPVTDKNITYKICAWNNFDSMSPIMPPQTIKKNAYNLTVQNNDVEKATLYDGVVTFEYWSTPIAPRTTKITLPYNATIYINDLQVNEVNLVEKLTRGAFYGNVSFEKNNGSTIQDYDTVYITDYKNYVVDHISLSEFKVYSKNTTDTILFNNNDPSSETTFQDIGGNTVAFADICENDVLSCKISNIDGKLKVVATVVKNQVSGIISEINYIGVNDSIYTINNTDYHLDTKSVSIDQLSLALDATFYIDILGNITWFEKYYPAPNYAYVFAAALSIGIDNRTEVKLFTDKGEFVVCKTATKVIVDGISNIYTADLINGYKFSTITGTLAADLYKEHGYGSATSISSADIPKLTAGQLITYRLNSFGEITAIDRPNTSVGTQTGLNGIFAQYGTMTPISEYSEATQTLTTSGNNVFLTDKTIVMVAYGTFEDDYELVNFSSMPYGMVFNNVKFYDVNRDGEVGVVVIGLPVTIRSDIAAICRVANAVNYDGDAIFRMNALQRGELTILNGTRNLTVAPIFGSAILPILNTRGEVNSFTTLAVPNDSSNTALFTAPTASGVLDGNVRYIYGLVTDRRSSTITTSGGNIVISGAANVYIYDERIWSMANRVLSGDGTEFDATLNGDVTTYDYDISKVYAIAREYNGKIADIMIYIFK